MAHLIRLEGRDGDLFAFSVPWAWAALRNRVLVAWAANARGAPVDSRSYGSQRAAKPCGTLSMLGATGPEGLQRPAGPLSILGATGPKGLRRLAGPLSILGATDPKGLRRLAGPLARCSSARGYQAGLIVKIILDVLLLLVLFFTCNHQPHTGRP
jgi:hypothetical protein